LGIVVNPSGWEITSGIILAALLAEAVWGRQVARADTWPKSTTLIIVGAEHRPLPSPGPGVRLGFWLDAGSVFTAGSSHEPGAASWRRVAFAVAPGIILGFLWTLRPPYVDRATRDGTLPTTAGDLITLVRPVPGISAPTPLADVWSPWLSRRRPLLLFCANVAAWGAPLAQAAGD